MRPNQRRRTEDPSIPPGYSTHGEAVFANLYDRIREFQIPPIKWRTYTPHELLQYIRVKDENLYYVVVLYLVGYRQNLWFEEALSSESDDEYYDERLAVRSYGRWFQAIAIWMGTKAITCLLFLSLNEAYSMDGEDYQSLKELLANILEADWEENITHWIPYLGRFVKESKFKCTPYLTYFSMSVRHPYPGVHMTISDAVRRIRPFTGLPGLINTWFAPAMYATEDAGNYLESALSLSLPILDDALNVGRGAMAELATQIVENRLPRTVLDVCMEGLEMIRSNNREDPMTDTLIGYSRFVSTVSGLRIAAASFGRFVRDLLDEESGNMDAMQARRRWREILSESPHINRRYGRVADVNIQDPDEWAQWING